MSEYDDFDFDYDVNTYCEQNADELETEYEYDYVDELKEHEDFEQADEYFNGFWSDEYF